MQFYCSHFEIKKNNEDKIYGKDRQDNDREKFLKLKDSFESIIYALIDFV